MSKFTILPYKQSSKSAKALAGGLACKRVLLSRRTFRHRPPNLVINWGNTGSLAGRGLHKDYVINVPEAIRLASNKLSTLRTLSRANVPTLVWTESIETATNWLQTGNRVYSRTILSSNSGKGILISKPSEDVSVHPAPLYTLGLTNWTEWRIHASSEGQLIAIQQKVKRNESTNDTSDIRNHGNDYIFKRNNLNIPNPEEALKVAVVAVRALGLHFGACDMAYLVDESAWVIIEVNTAPGLTGSTITDYVNYFKTL